ncbi:MAG: hypothetical protein U1E87_09575 [Alphaproteobacteria bacterium]
MTSPRKLNAYRRYVPNLFVPVNRHWGINNRSTGLRIPAGDSAARRIEHRVSGADSNPYLVLAAILAGALHGLEEVRSRHALHRQCLRLISIRRCPGHRPRAQRLPGFGPDARLSR